MATGRLPWVSEAADDMVPQIMSGKYSIPDEVPPGLAAAIRKMIVVEPAHRWTSRELEQAEWFGPKPTRVLPIPFTGGLIAMRRLSDGGTGKGLAFAKRSTAVTSGTFGGTRDQEAVLDYLRA
jgi:serine/threonine protein kinase